MNLLFIGDIVGKGGRNMVKKLAPLLREKYGCSFVIANGENSANGKGINAKCADDILTAVDVITMGDHTWDQKTFLNEISQYKNLIRPANYHESQPGKGFCIVRNEGAGEVAVINLLGKVFMKDSAYCPFETVTKILARIPKTVKCIIVDFHAEATSEKVAMGYFLDGKVTAVLGTHTHVQTADAKILGGGTAFMCDVGMVGAEYSVIGRDADAVVGTFSTGLPSRFTVVEDDIRLDAAVISYNLSDGKATKIENISVHQDEYKDIIL